MTIEEPDFISIMLYFIGQPVSAISVYLRDDLYAMVEPQTKDVVGIHIEALEHKFLAKHPLLKKSWPYVKQTLTGKSTSNSLLQLFSFGLAFLLQEDEKALLQAA